MVTIKDISKIAGCSPTTVSKSLNDYQEIPKVTRDRIKKIALEIGYVPNSSARSLKTKKSWTIGVIFDEISGVGLKHPFFSSILESFRKEAEKVGYDIMFISRSLGGKKANYFEHSTMKRVEAILVLCAPFNSPDMQQIFASSIPNVVIDYLGNTTTTITSSIDNSVREALLHLKELGHKNIAHIYGSDVTFVGRERKRVFIDSMKQIELDVRPEYLISGEYFSRAEGYYAMNQLLALKEIPTAVFCASDMMAVGAIEAIQEKGLQVPTDISVIGFDGIEMSQMFKPKLSTIQQDTEQMGILAANLLFKMIESYKKPEEANIHYVDSVYLEKESTGTSK